MNDSQEVHFKKIVKHNYVNCSKMMLDEMIKCYIRIGIPSGAFG